MYIIQNSYMQKKPGLALDGQIKHEDTYLASSTMYVGYMMWACTLYMSIILIVNKHKWRLIFIVYPHFLSLPVGMEEIKEVRENLGVMVHYSVKVRCIVSFGRCVCKHALLSVYVLLLILCEV